jgi:hypothetical protein
MASNGECLPGADNLPPGANGYVDGKVIRLSIPGAMMCFDQYLQRGQSERRFLTANHKICDDDTLDNYFNNLPMEV